MFSAHSLAVFPALLVIRLYQWCISPLLGTRCRFEPSCSAYAADAVNTHGLLRGSLLAVKRIARCQPFANAGYDPVPPVTHDHTSFTHTCQSCRR
jgi:putative membrane protein insertion efficiency factor